MNKHYTQEEYDKTFKIKKSLEPHEGIKPQDYKWWIVDPETNQRRIQVLGISNHKDRFGVFWAITDIETEGIQNFANRYSGKREAQTELDRFAKENVMYRLEDAMNEVEIQNTTYGWEIILNGKLYRIVNTKTEANRIARRLKKEGK